MPNIIMHVNIADLEQMYTNVQQLESVLDRIKCVSCGSNDIKYSGTIAQCVVNMKGMLKKHGFGVSLEDINKA